MVYQIFSNLRYLTGKKVASRKQDVLELVEHFNVSTFPVSLYADFYLS